MTESLLQKLEERMMVLLTEMESLRNEVSGLRQENSNLKTSREKLEERLKGILSLLDSVNSVESAAA